MQKDKAGGDSDLQLMLSAVQPNILLSLMCTQFYGFFSPRHSHLIDEETEAVEGYIPHSKPYRYGPNQLILTVLFLVIRLWRVA